MVKRWLDKFHCVGIKDFLTAEFTKKSRKDAKKINEEFDSFLSLP
jgi:hypothetical protein